MPKLAQKHHSLEDASLPSRDTIIEEARRSFTEAMPRIEGLASAYLHVRGCPAREKDEEVAEVVGVAWKNYLTLSLRGRNVEAMLGRIVEFAAMGVRSGRGLVGATPINDTMSPRARYKHGLTKLGEPREHERVEKDDPAEQAALNVDIEEWLETLDERQRAVAERLREGYNSADIGRERGVTRAAIYLTRLELAEEWERFQGEEG